MSDVGPPGQPSNTPTPRSPLPPGRPPFAPPPGTPYYGPPHDAEWTPPPGTVFGGGPDVLVTTGRGQRGRNPWPLVARPVPANPDEPRPDTGSRAVAVLLAIAAIVAALITARASLASSDASSFWQSSVGDEQRRGALLLEGVRYTYGTEGDLAFMVVTADVTAQELRAIAGAQPPEIAARVTAEADVQQQLVELVVPSSELMSDPRYRLDSGGMDLQLRLADARNAQPADIAIDPLIDLAAGDAAADHATRSMLATIAIGASFLFGALAQPLRRRRRPLLVLGWVALLAGGAAALAVELGVPGVAA